MRPFGSSNPAIRPAARATRTISRDIMPLMGRRAPDQAWADTRPRLALRTSTHILRPKEYIHRYSILAVIAVCSMLSNHEALATYRSAKYLDPTTSSIMTLSSLLT